MPRPVQSGRNQLEQLRYIRGQVGYSQQDLANASGVSQHTISEIELGRRKPQGRTLRKLAKVLGVRVADFYTEADYPKAPPVSALPDDLREALDKVNELRDKWEHHDEDDVAALEDEINTLAPFLQVTLNLEMQWLRAQFPGEQDVTERAVVGPQIAAYLQIYMDSLTESTPAARVLVEQLRSRLAS